MNQQEQIIKVLTIGQIAYYDSQKCFVNHLANSNNISLSFVGSGPASEPLFNYVHEQGINNVSFVGRYEKKDEVNIVKPFHMINIWLKNNINADSCMANRFYLAAQLRKPMIVNKGSYMADLCEKYQLGVILDESDSFEKEIIKWWNAYEHQSFFNNCISFLRSVKQEVALFESNILLLYQN